MKKTYYLVLDTETANSLEDNLPYDIGYQVIDKKGHVFEERSFAIAEIFDWKDLMATAYYKDKLPLYYKKLKNKEMTKASIWTIRKLIFNTIEKYNIKEVYAYNASFDIRALNNLVRYLSGSSCRYFFKYGLQICDIWHIACQILGTQKTFQWENIRNANGNLITNAERMFCYCEDIDFEEAHTGLEDARVEAQILVRCLKSHKSINKRINRGCWRIPQRVAAA